MGTINYKTSKYITLGVKTDYEDYEEMLDAVNFLHDDVKYILEKTTFNFWKLSIDYGYYDGFSIDIEQFYTDNEEEEKEQKQEFEQVKNMLKELTQIGLYCVIPRMG